MSNELKPCPFCGSEDIRFQFEFHPICSKCGATQDKIIGTHAVRSWNLRTIPEGYALVPVEPTEEMCQDGFNAYQDVGSISDAYKAMLEAANPKGEQS